MVLESGSSLIAFGVVGSKNLGGGIAGVPSGVVNVCTDKPSMVGHESFDLVRPLVFSSAPGALLSLIPPRGESWGGAGHLSLGAWAARSPASEICGSGGCFSCAGSSASCSPSLEWGDLSTQAAGSLGCLLDWG